MRRTPITALLGLVLATAACRDVGLEDNRPLEEAMQRPPSALVAAVHTPAAEETQPVIVEGRLWVPAGTPVTLPATELRPIGSARGHTLYARAWARSPYGQVFTRVQPDSADAPTETAAAGPASGERWQAYAPVLGRSGAVPRSTSAGSGEDHPAPTPDTADESGPPSSPTEPAAPAPDSAAGGH